MIDRSIPISRFVLPELKNNRSQTSIYVSNFACAGLQFFPSIKLSLLLFMNINHIFNKKRKHNDKILFELDFR